MGRKNHRMLPDNAERVPQPGESYTLLAARPTEDGVTPADSVGSIRVVSVASGRPAYAPTCPAA